MRKKLLILAAAAALVMSLLAACDTQQPIQTGGETEMTGGTEGGCHAGIQILTYPREAVQTLEERDIKLSKFSARTAGAATYKGNTHYDGTSVVISSHFTATVEDMELPVYAAPVYIAKDNRGTLHSYASVDVDFFVNAAVTFTIKPADFVRMRTAQVFAHDPATLTYDEEEIRLTVTANGTYTVVLNDEQDYAVTLFVRNYEDEEANIARYKQQYGEYNVRVFEPGLHEIDYLLLGGNSVLYLKAGAILLPKHTFDITDEAAAAGTPEAGAVGTNGLGLNRYPVINGYASNNIVIAGRGTVDMTQLDWHERRGIVFSLCDNITIDGVIVVNPCEWAFITYRCTNVTITQSAVLGYRTNSDAFAICNTIGATITDCFARTGDDMFEVKTLGGVDGAVSKDITYTRCQAWGSKARCFGVIGEIEKDVSNILFQDSIVIFRDAVWDNDRIGSLVVLRECGRGAVDGVTFRNITVHYDWGRAIQVGVYSHELANSRMENIVFENITYQSNMKSQVRLNTGAGNMLQIVFRNVTVNGEALTQENLYGYFDLDRNFSVEFE